MPCFAIIVLLALPYPITFAGQTVERVSTNATTNGPVLAYEEPTYLAGSIYADGPEPRQLLYRFTRNATRNGTQLDVVRDFNYPDGRLAARERVRYEGDALISYALDELQIGMSGRVTIHQQNHSPKETIEFTYGRKDSDHLKTRTEVASGPLLIADMVGAFLPAHWAELQKGEKLICRYIVVPRRETIGFTFSKLPEPKGEDGRSMTVKMEPSSTLISVLVQPLFFTLDDAPPHRVLRYAGRTTPKKQVGNKWEDLDALTTFDWRSAR